MPRRQKPAEINNNEINYMGDEAFYYQAMQEVRGENRDSALWAKALALAEGNEKKAEYKYIKLKVSQETGDTKADGKPSPTRENNSIVLGLLLLSFALGLIFSVKSGEIALSAGGLGFALGTSIAAWIFSAIPVLVVAAVYWLVKKRRMPWIYIPAGLLANIFLISMMLAA